MKATFLKKVDGFLGDARLYRCDDGSPVEYVVASAVDVPFIGEETMVFRSDENGHVTDWGELGVCDGLDHKKALLDAGYESVS